MEKRELVDEHHHSRIVSSITLVFQIEGLSLSVR